MRLPAAGRVGRRLLAGALVFGIGWGVAGVCPGPALVALGIGSAEALAFVAAVIVGMALVGLGDRRPRASADKTLAPPMQADRTPR